MTKFRTVKRKGKKQAIPINQRKSASINRTLSAVQVNRMGIRNPGSLSELGYRMKDQWQQRKDAIDAAVKKYGKNRTAWKFSDLVRMNSHRPELRKIALHDLRYVTGEN
ncbi:MAG: hypothetical protein M1129_01235 [Candidatus Thermoplasmatota archaeon]|nr:hypothetical protein [Candidatus Thermoplasmatota archaeon]